jgi:hypothetical protein
MDYSSNLTMLLPLPFRRGENSPKDSRIEPLNLPLAN